MTLSPEEQAELSRRTAAMGLPPEAEPLIQVTAFFASWLLCHRIGLLVRALSDAVGFTSSKK